MESKSEHSNTEPDRLTRPQTPDSSVPDDVPARLREYEDHISGYGAGLQLKSPTLTPGRFRPSISRNQQRKTSRTPQSPMIEARAFDLGSPRGSPKFSEIDYSAPPRVVSPFAIMENISKVQEIFAGKSGFQRDGIDDEEEISPKDLRQKLPVSNPRPAMTDGMTQTLDTDSDEDAVDIRREEPKALRAKIPHLLRHKHDLEKLMTNLESETADMRKEISKRKIEIHNLRTDNMLLADTRAQAETNLALALEEKAELIKNHTDAILKLKAEISECTRMNDHQVTLLDNTDKYFTCVRNECEQLKKQSEFLRKRNTDLQEMLKMHEAAAGDNEKLFSYITRARDYQVKQDLEHLMSYDRLERHFEMSRTRHASVSSAVPVYQTQTLGDFMQTLSNSHRGSIATLASLPMSVAMSAHMSPYSSLRGLKLFNLSPGDVVYAIQMGISPIKPMFRDRSRSKTMHTLTGGKRPSIVCYQSPYVSRNGTMIQSPLSCIDGSVSDESDKDSCQATTDSSGSDTKPSQPSTNKPGSNKANPTKDRRPVAESYSKPQDPSSTAHSNKDVAGSGEASPALRRRSFAKRYSKLKSPSWIPDSNNLALGLAGGDPFIESPTESKHMEAASSGVSYHDTSSTRRRSSQFVISPTSFTTQQTERRSVLSSLDKAKNEAEELRSGSNSSGKLVDGSPKKPLIDFSSQQSNESAPSTPQSPHTPDQSHPSRTTTPSTLEFSPVRTLSSCNPSLSVPNPELVSSHADKRISTGSQTSKWLKKLQHQFIQVYYAPQITETSSPTYDDYTPQITQISSPTCDYYDDDDSTSPFSIADLLDCQSSPSTVSINPSRSDPLSLGSEDSPVAPKPLALRLVTASPIAAKRAAKCISLEPIPGTKPVTASPVSTPSPLSASSPPSVASVRSVPSPYSVASSNSGKSLRSVKSPRSVRSVASFRSVASPNNGTSPQSVKSPRSVASPVSTASPISTANSDQDQNEKQMSGDTFNQPPLQNDQRHPSISKLMTVAKRLHWNPTKNFGFLEKFALSTKAKKAPEDHQKGSAASLESTPEVKARLSAIFDGPLPSLHEFNTFYSHYAQRAIHVTYWGDFQWEFPVSQQRRLFFWAWTKVIWSVVTCLILVASIFGYMPTKGPKSMESDFMMNKSSVPYLGEKYRRESPRPGAETAWDQVVKDETVLPWIGRPRMALIFSPGTESVNFFTVEGPNQPITETCWSTISDTKHEAVAYAETEKVEATVTEHHAETSIETSTETDCTSTETSTVTFTQTDCTSTSSRTESEEKKVTSTVVDHILLPWVRNHTSTITNTLTSTSTKTLPLSFTVTKQISLLCTEPILASRSTKVITVTDVQKSTVTEGRTKVITVMDIQKSTETETKTETHTKQEIVTETETVAAPCVACTPYRSSHLQAQPQPEQHSPSTSTSYDTTARYRQANNNKHLKLTDAEIMPAWSMVEPDRYADVGPGYIGPAPWLQRWCDNFRFIVEEWIQPILLR